MGKSYKAWLALLALIAVFVVTYQWTDPKNTSWTRKPLKSPDQLQPNDEFPPASLEAGRVASLQTSKGTIEFVLFEKDCPKTTQLLAMLVEDGRYDGKKFIRVEKNCLIKTSNCRRGIAPPPPEYRKGLLHEKGSVGLAQWKKPGDACGAIYITMEPLHHLDYKYTAFGRVIAGMDVVGKVSVGDTIKKASVRRPTPEDKKRLDLVLVKETERRVD